MRELGEHSAALHAGLAPAVLSARTSTELILIGDEMRPLDEALGTACTIDRVDKRRRSHRRAAADAPCRAMRCWSRRRNSVGLAKLVERMAKGLACST